MRWSTDSVSGDLGKLRLIMRVDDSWDLDRSTCFVGVYKIIALPRVISDWLLETLPRQVLACLIFGDKTTSDLAVGCLLSDLKDLKGCQLDYLS